ncbi:hypothetical protein WA026_010540 [Henosepilachna vigintioctopunctata]|uniref:SSD domain-containing protein n=1 Tax=Henosepilachna vigintioctopunctata TaxID=420089 RepID=A0AAW1VBG6_9CUCU
MNLRWFANIVVHHPLAITLAVIVFSGTCLIIPFTKRSQTFPSFSDPQLGFSTRGTVIANRITTWENLIESTRPSGKFTVNPKELILQNTNMTVPMKRKKGHSRKKSKKEYGNILISEKRNFSDNNYENWKEIKKMTNSSFSLKAKVNRESEGYFCGYPDEKYAHVVVTSVDNSNLFNLPSLMTLCQLEYELSNAQNFSDLCVQNTKTSKCCKPWSLGNYIALLHNRTSCLGVNEEDINSTVSLLNKCAKYYFSLKLLPDCSQRIFHCEVPKECVKYDAVYNILNFLVPTSFISESYTTLEEVELHETMIFLPLAASSAILPYFHEVENIKLSFSNIQIIAMDFGIKSMLFDEYLVHDMWLMSVGTIFILISMWLYTKSFFLTLVTIIGIIFSLGISYFLYVLVFELKFFPFMNLLAIIVAIGIGSDDAFIFCKVWLRVKQESNDRPMVHMLTDTFHHAFVSIFVTTLTTTVAFMASYISSVTATCCFSIFAGTAVMANFLLMVTWFPACLILWEKSRCSKDDKSINNPNSSLYRRCLGIRDRILIMLTKWPKFMAVEKIWYSKEKYLLNCVIRLRYLWITIFSSIAIGGVVIVLYYPKLKLPDSQEFQLFASSHPFEQYDFVYKNHFWFHRESLHSDSNYELPLRFVWGVLPVDNGDHLDPTNLGTLELDPDFDMSAPSSQVWLLKFCKSLKREPFFRAMMGPLLPNCFIETFMKSMQRTCLDFMSGEDRSPCCKSSIFPYSPKVFDKCIIQEMADIYETPSEFLIPGVAGPKFSKDEDPTIKVVVVEYVSNYSYSMSYDVMNNFFNQVESWMQKQLLTAPKGMHTGWFVSELRFYDLQRELATSTLYGIFLSMTLALIVLLFSTMNLLISFFAILTITFSIFVSIAILVLLGWKLNILESVAISTAVGLAVDFSLHYSVHYRLCPVGLVNNRQAAAGFALSNMAGPALMAAITTGAVGAFMLPSLILPYIQIGIFLVIVMSVSWLYATFFLGSLLASLGPQNHFSQFSYSKICRCLNGKPSRDRARSRPTNSSISDTHELETLTDKTLKTISKSLQKSCRGCSNQNRVLSDQSPSATSAITIIMADDN